MNKVYLISAKRSAIGSMLGTLKDVSPTKLGADVLRDLVDVFHQGNGIAEGVGVHVLHQVGLWLAVGTDEFDSVCMIDIAGLNGLIADIFPFNAEPAADFFQLLIKIHKKFLSSC